MLSLRLVQLMWNHSILSLFTVHIMLYSDSKVSDVM